MQNPILSLIKTGAFVVLAVLVGLSFWQRLKEEDRTEMLGKRISDVEVSIGRLTTTISKLDRRIQKGGAAVAASGGSLPMASASLPAIRKSPPYAGTWSVPEVLGHERAQNDMSFAVFHALASSPLGGRAGRGRKSELREF